MDFQPVKNAIAVISVENVQITQGGNPPTKVILTCKSQTPWRYNAKQGQVNCAAIMTIGARIKISYDVVESTKYAGTMLKFINDAVPAQPGEVDTFPAKEKYTGGGGGGSTGSSTGSSTGGSSGFSKDGQFRTPVQIQRQEVALAVATLRSGGTFSTIEDFLAECDKVLAWADQAPDASFQAGLEADNGSPLGQAPVTSLADTPAPSADEDSEFPF